MDDFEKNSQDPLGDPAAQESPYAEGMNPQNGPVSAPDGEQRDNGYAFETDGTYRYVRPQNEDPARAPEQRNADPNAQAPGGQTMPPYGGVYRQNEPYNQGYPYGAQRENPFPTGQNNAYPYGANSYPYYNAPSYAYNNEEEHGTEKKSKGGKIFAIIAGVLCIGLAAMLIIVSVNKNGKKETKTSTPSEASEEASNESNVNEIVTEKSPAGADNDAETGALTSTGIYKKVKNSSVGILVYDKSETLASEGSGVLFTEDNDGKYTYIITCAHVIADAGSEIMVQLADGEEYSASVVGYDTRTDIGVIKIEENGLQLAEIGDSDALSVGDTVYAIGNPGGVEFANSFTNGMISALDRPVASSSTGYTMECIQHTAAINPGNSGGALVNEYGQLIGINSMKIVDDEYEGMGFSVPSSVFIKIVNEIIRNGYVTNRPKLGITYVPASSYSSYGMFVSIKGLPSGCIVIYSIADDSPLVGTEAKEGDMITAVNGVDLDDKSYLSELIENSNVGDELTLSLVRINKDYSYEEFDVTVKLVEDRGDTIITQEEETTAGYDSYEDFFRQFFGDNFGGGFGDDFGNMFP